MIEIHIDAYPPSANQLYKRNRNSSVRLSEKHLMFRNMVFVNSRFKEKVTKYPVSIEILLFAPDNRKRDLDNVNKVVLDSLVNAGVLTDDSNKHINDLRTSNIGFLCDGVGKTIIRIKTNSDEA